MVVGLNNKGRLSKDLEGFYETLYSFTKLSPCAVDVATYLARQRSLYFDSDKQFRAKFTSYSDIRVKQAIKELTKKGFIFSNEKRGAYRLNENVFILSPLVNKIILTFENGQMTISYEET